MPVNKTVNDLFRIYARRLGIGESLLGNQIYFVYDASYLDVNDRRLISDVFESKNDSSVTVIDQNNVIGA